jgi:hypothetical protein
LTYLAKFDALIQNEPDKITHDILKQSIDEKRGHIKHIINNIKNQRPKSSQDLTFDYPTFDHFISGFSKALFTEQIDFYACFIVKYLDYLSNQAIVVKNYRVS